MSLNLSEIVTSLDQNEDIHLARIIVLLFAFRKNDETAIHGITKLAKLDFLLRYPSCFKQAMLARGVRTQNIPVDDQEVLTIEAQMVRYRYGPWDHRYRRFLNILAAKGLIQIAFKGKAVSIDLTHRGEHLGSELVLNEGFGRIYDRAKLLRKHLDLKARRLMELVYEIFPELSSMEFNENIDIRENV